MPLENAKYSFQLQSADPRRPLPRHLVIGQNDPETSADVLLKLLAFLLLFRDRLRIGPHLHDPDIPYVPDLVATDYELRPVLWVECGECEVKRLNRLAVKVPDATIWVVKRSLPEVEQLWAAVRKNGLRPNRYCLVGLDAVMFDEALGLLQSRNQVLWVGGSFDPPAVRFDLNGLWFEAPITVIHH